MAWRNWVPVLNSPNRFQRANHFICTVSDTERAGVVAMGVAYIELLLIYHDRMNQLMFRLVSKVPLNCGTLVVGRASLAKLVVSIGRYPLFILLENMGKYINFLLYTSKTC